MGCKLKYFKEFALFSVVTRRWK